MKYHAYVYCNGAEQHEHAVAMRMGLKMLRCDLGRIYDALIRYTSLGHVPGHLR